MLQIIDKAKMFREIVNEMADLYEKKNANYGDSFGQLFDALGPVSGLVPLHNKLDRATSLIKGNKNNFESLEDTFEDMACYAIMNLMETRIRNQKIGEQGELTTAVFVEPEKTKEKLDLPEYNSKDGKWYYKGQLANGWCYNKDGLMTGEGYSDGCPVRDMVYRTYDCTPHHFVSNDYKTATLKIVEPIDFNFPSESITAKDPCAGCPWNQNVLFGTSKPYVGDTPCQWCEHGKLTCANINYCTSTTVDNTNNIKIKATSSTGLEDSIVNSIDLTTATSIMKDGTGERVSIETSGIMDEYWDVDLNSLYTTNDDELTIEEMAEAEREERAVWENIYSKYMTKRGDK
jgi:hypothetical protein